MIRLFFATPCYRSDPHAALEWAKRIAAALRVNMIGDAPVSPFLAVSEAQLVQRFLASDATHFFSREDDVFVEATVLQRMLELGRPVVVAPYFVRGTTRFETMTDDAGEVLWSGLGCALIRRDVLEAMWSAYRDELSFVQDRVELVHLFRDLFAERDDGIQLLKSDHAFWWRCRALGYRITALEDVTVNHAGQVSRYRAGDALTVTQASVRTTA